MASPDGSSSGGALTSSVGVGQSLNSLGGGGGEGEGDTFAESVFRSGGSASGSGGYGGRGGEDGGGGGGRGGGGALGSFSSTPSSSAMYDPKIAALRNNPTWCEFV